MVMTLPPQAEHCSLLELQAVGSNPYKIAIGVRDIDHSPSPSRLRPRALGFVGLQSFSWAWSLIELLSAFAEIATKLLVAWTGVDSTNPPCRASPRRSRTGKRIGDLGTNEAQFVERQETSV